MSTVSEQATSLIQELLQVPMEELIRAKELGSEFGFEEVRDGPQALQGFSSRLSTVKWDNYPSPTVSTATQKINEVKGIYTSIQSFSPDELSSKNKNVAQERRALIGKVPQIYKSLFDACAHLVAYSRTEESELGVKIKQLDSSIASVATKIDEAEKAADSAKNVAGKTGVGAHADIFNTEASKFSGYWKWLWGTVGFGVAIVVCSVGFVFVDPTCFLPDQPFKGGDAAHLLLTKYHLASVTIAKLIVVAMLITGLTVCLRNYKAYWHNVITNQHRHNALNTFETFSSAAGNPEIKDAILTQATNCIFSHRATGYLKEGIEVNEIRTVIPPKLSVE